MTKLLIIAASLSITASAALACDIHPAGTHASKVDDTTVSSITSGDAQKMSTPSSTVTTSTVVLEDQTAAPAKTE